MIKHSVLVVADANFQNEIEDFPAYQKKLVEFLTNKTTNVELEVLSVKGRFCFDGELPAIDIDDKNKTSFVKSISDYLSKIDEVIVITNYLHEPYLESLRNQLNEESVPTSVFSYPVREKNEQ